MMAVNPSLQRSRATAGQRSTLVSRLTGLLTSSATAPGSHPSVPASDPANPDIAVRGRLVHAWRAREAARVNAGVPALDALGYNPRFARHDDENGARAAATRPQLIASAPFPAPSPRASAGSITMTSIPIFSGSTKLVAESLRQLSASAYPIPPDRHP